MRAPAKLGSLQLPNALLVTLFLMPDDTYEVVGRACSAERKKVTRLVKNWVFTKTKQTK
jgi:hypothetical protein